jgi:hypothetical protein
MDITLLQSPDKRETVDLTIDDTEYYDISYHQWEDIINQTTNGHISYTIWEQTDDGMDTLTLEYTIQDNNIIHFTSETL